MALNNLAENAERLSRRIQESLQERTRELTKSNTASYLDAPDLDRTVNLSKLLDSNSEREKLDGLKRIIAMISRNRNVSAYFAQVIKNVASQNLEIKKLVYIYLLRYASIEPDLALLSINTFQKDLADPNPLIRAMALRVLSGIPVASIGSVIATAIKKCASDSSPYVRRAAALAIPKCYNLDSTHLPTLMQTLSLLLRDRSPLSIGYVIVAFSAICPARFELLHQNYRNLCRLLVDADEWGQVHILDVLGRYARTMLRKPDEERGKAAAQEGQDSDESHIDADLSLLLRSAEPLLHSRNPAVVMAVARTFYYIAPPSDHEKVVRPLLRILHSSKEIERVVLGNLCVVAKDSPSLLKPHVSRFYIRAGDFSATKAAKMELLVMLLDDDNAQQLLREFKDYVLDTDDALVSKAVWAIGQCAITVFSTMETCLLALTMLIRSSNDVSVTAAVLALKTLHQRLQLESRGPPESALSLVPRLASYFDLVRNPKARACILWMVGQYARKASDMYTPFVPKELSDVQPWAPDILRKAVKVFKSEDSTVKLQTLTLAAKLFTLAPDHTPTRLLARYTFQLARYDLDYDVRDRARFLSSLLAGVHGGLFGDGEDEVEQRDGVILRVEQVQHILFEGKAAPVEEIHWSSKYTTLGSTSLITQKEMPGDDLRRFPEWSNDGTDPTLRDTEEDVQPPPFFNQSRYIGIGSQNLAPPTGVPSPVVLTPGGVSPAGSVPKPGLAGPKPQFMDLEAFFKSDEEGSEEEEEEEDSDEEPVLRKQPTASTSSTVPQTSHQPPRLASSPPREVRLPPEEHTSEEEVEADDEEYEEEESEGEDEDEEDAFLRRG